MHGIGLSIRISSATTRITSAFLKLFFVVYNERYRHWVWLQPENISDLLFWNGFFFRSVSAFRQFHLMNPSDAGNRFPSSPQTNMQIQYAERFLSLNRFICPSPANDFSFFFTHIKRYFGCDFLINNQVRGGRWKSLAFYYVCVCLHKFMNATQIKGVPLLINSLRYCVFFFLCEFNVFVVFLIKQNVIPFFSDLYLN